MCSCHFVPTISASVERWGDIYVHSSVCLSEKLLSDPYLTNCLTDFHQIW